MLRADNGVLRDLGGALRSPTVSRRYGANRACNSYRPDGGILSPMRLAGLTFFVALSVRAQIQPEARALLEGVSAAARAARTFHAEGVSVLEVTGDGTVNRMETSFNYSTSDARHVRWESAGANAGLRVCDGDFAWIQYGRAGVHNRTSIEPTHCDPPVPRWDTAAEQLVAAEIEGRERVLFGGGATDCTTVRAEYESTARLVIGLANAGKTLLRSVC